MSLETKVGAFVVSGLALIAVAIFLLGDYTFERRYKLYVTFRDVANLSENAPVKLAGVEIGKVTKLELSDGGAKVVAAIRSGVDIYKDASFEIGSTGIIGSKYLAINQGHPSAGTIPPDSTITGTDPVSIEKALAKALDSFQGILKELTDEGPRGSLTTNLKDTVANVREMTANLNDLIESTRPKLERAMDRTDSITAKLDDLLVKSNMMMAGLATDKGAVGALLHDEKVKEDVKLAVTSVKEMAVTAKDVLSRLNSFRVFWNYDWRYEHAIHTGRVDLGLKIQPRETRYYYLGASNLANVSDDPKNTPDYVQKNRIDALLGFVNGPFDLGVGVLRSVGGGRLTVTPFYQHPVGKRVSLIAEALDFSRNRVVEGRRFDKPQYNLAIAARITKWLGIGARVEDLATVSRYQSWINISFEDKDVAYLFGLASFGAAGTRGRSARGAGN